MTGRSSLIAILALTAFFVDRAPAQQQQQGGGGQQGGGQVGNFGPQGGGGAVQSGYGQAPVDYNLNRYFYYPYYYFPHNYWPQQSPRYPEPVGAPYMKPPAYMAYPAFREPHWRYELFEPQRYYRGFHFWLDQF